MGHSTTYRLVKKRPTTAYSNACQEEKPTNAGLLTALRGNRGTTPGWHYPGCHRVIPPLPRRWLPPSRAARQSGIAPQPAPGWEAPAPSARKGTGFSLTSGREPRVSSSAFPHSLLGLLTQQQQQQRRHCHCLTFPGVQPLTRPPLPVPLVRDRHAARATQPRPPRTATAPDPRGHCQPALFQRSAPPL